MKLQIPIGLIRFLNRYNLTIFVVFVLGGFALILLALTHVVTSSTTSDQTSFTSPANPDAGANASIPTLDQATMKKVDELQPSGQPSPLPNYQGRINPFSE